MTGKKYEKPLHIDLDFDEALERFVGTDPNDLPDNIKLKKKKPKANLSRAASGKDVSSGDCGRQPPDDDD